MMDNPWHFLELILNTWFLGELLLSFIFAPNRKRFFSEVMTWIDVFAVVPYFIVLAVARDKLDSFQFLRILRLFRVCRIIRFLKHSEHLSLVGNIFLSCADDMKVLLLCVVLVVVLAGSIMFYLERQSGGESKITTIPAGMYWGAQTLFTIGYGDLIPFTKGGKVFAGAFMVLAASAFVIPLLSIIAKFQTEWNVDHHWINKLG